MANWKKTVFSSPWKTTRPRVMSSTCERFYRFSSRKGNSCHITVKSPKTATANADSTCPGIKTNCCVSVSDQDTSLSW